MYKYSIPIWGIKNYFRKRRTESSHPPPLHQVSNSWIASPAAWQKVSHLESYFLVTGAGRKIQIESYPKDPGIRPKKGINPTILLWGWDWDHQTYSREGYGSLGIEWCKVDPSHQVSSGGYGALEV